jgi:hypothetical protein
MVCRPRMLEWYPEEASTSFSSLFRLVMLSS